MDEDLKLLPREELTRELIDETDENKLKDIISLFNTDLQKRNMIRVIKYSDLSDKLLEQIESRIDKKPGEFSNEELLKYLQVIQNYASSSSDIINPDKVPKIQINNTKIENVGNNVELSRESKEKVMSAVDAILAGLKAEETFSQELDFDQPIDVESKEVK